MSTPPLPASRPPAVTTSPALAVTGFLMVLALFLIANRISGLDARLPAWPWEVFSEGGHSLASRTLALLWGVTGLGLILLSFSSNWRIRTAFGLGMAAFLLVECTQGSAGLTSEVYNLNQLLPMVLLGGGLLLARRPGMESRGRIVGVLGGLSLIIALAIGFTEAGVSLLGATIYDVEMLLRDAPLPDDQRYYHWYTTIPRALVVSFAFVGFLACALVPKRPVLLACVLGLGAGLVVPLAARFMALANARGALTAGSAVEAGVFIMVDHGLLLWLLGTLSISDWREPGTSTT